MALPLPFQMRLRRRLADADKAQTALLEGRLLPGAAFSPANAAQRRDALGKRAFDWPGIARAFADGMAGLTPSRAQAQALLALDDARTCFVVTGQQPGLLGGPALAWLKALTAVAMAEKQSRELHVPVIPVFWIAGDDSDLAEANAAEFIGPADGVTPPLRLPFEDPRAKKPVGSRQLDEAAHRVLLEGLPAGWPAPLRELASRSYAPGATLVSAFREIMQAVLGPTGILFIDAHSPALRALTAQPLRELLRRAPEFFTALRGAEAAAQRDFQLDPQVQMAPHALPAFIWHRGERLRLMSTGREGEGIIHCPQAGLADIGGDFEGLSLSHDALSRLLVTDAAFPVLGHILGPAELRYAVQLAEAMPRFTGGQPLIHPRQSFCALPEDLAKDLEADGIPESLWPGLKPSEWKRRIRKRAWTSHPAAEKPPLEWIGPWEKSIRRWQDEFSLAGVDTEALKRRLLQDLGAFQAKVEAHLAQRLPGYHSTAERLRALALGQGQDRHLNLLSLWAMLGEDGLGALADELDPLHAGVQLFLLHPKT